MSLDFAVTQILNGITMSVLLILISLGLSVVLGLMRILNMAHGELFILGAFTGVWLKEAGLGFWPSLLVAPLALGLLGLVIHELLLRRLYARASATVLATYGLGLVIRQLLQIAMGVRPHAVGLPLSGSVTLFGFAYPAYRVFIIVAGTALILGVVLLYLRSTFGIQIRAAIHNPQLASAVGIDTVRVNATSFALGAAIAGLAGALLAPLIPVGPASGMGYLVRVFFIVIVGGGGSVLGTIPAGIIIGGGESLLQLVMSPFAAEVGILVIGTVIAYFRPKGLVTPH